MSNADIEKFLTFIQNVPYGRTIYDSCVIRRITMYDNQKTKSSMIVTDLDLLLMLFFESIISVTISFSVVKKRYQHRFFFKIKGGHFIMNLGRSAPIFASN